MTNPEFRDVLQVAAGKHGAFDADTLSGADGAGVADADGAFHVPFQGGFDVDTSFVALGDYCDHHGLRATSGHIIKGLALVPESLQLLGGEALESMTSVIGAGVVVQVSGLGLGAEVWVQQEEVFAAGATDDGHFEACLECLLGAACHGGNSGAATYEANVAACWESEALAVWAADTDFATFWKSKHGFGAVAFCFHSEAHFSVWGGEAGAHRDFVDTWDPDHAERSCRASR